MLSVRNCSEIRLVNGSTGDPGLFIDYTGKDDALLFDAGENGGLDPKRLSDLAAVFITHHHVDHFIGLDRIVRANLDRDKALHIYGPAGTITKVYDRIKSYEYPFFPFQKIVLDVHEIIDGHLRSALLECSRRFPAPKIVETVLDSPLIFELRGLKVETVPVDHTVPCLAYALVETSSLELIAERVKTGTIPPGPWIDQVVTLSRSGADEETLLGIQGTNYSLRELRDQFFRTLPERRIAYVTDTAWSGQAQPGLLRLAHKAQRLYCDSFYAKAQESQAQKHRHMTTIHAAEFAQRAEVDELVLIHFAARYQGRYQTLLNEARARFPNTSADFSEVRP